MTYGKYDEAQEVLRTTSVSRNSFDYFVRDARLQDKTRNLKRAKLSMTRALSEAQAYAQSPAVIAWCLVTLGHFEHHSGNPEKAVENYLAALER